MVTGQRASQLELPVYPVRAAYPLSKLECPEIPYIWFECNSRLDTVLDKVSNLVILILG